MSYIMIDVETDGPIPGDFSMISIGAVIVRPGLADTFYGELQPISPTWDDEALKISGHTREETLRFEDPAVVLSRLEAWVLAHNEGKRVQIHFGQQRLRLHVRHLGTSGTFSGELHSVTARPILARSIRDLFETTSRTSSTCASPSTRTTRSMLPWGTQRLCCS